MLNYKVNTIEKENFKSHYLIWKLVLLYIFVTMDTLYEELVAQKAGNF